MEKNSIILNILKILLYLLFAFVINQSMQYIFPAANSYPDFFLTLIWAFSYLFGGTWSFLVIILSGFLRDWLFSPIMGLSILIGILTALFSSNIFQVVWQRKPFFFPVQAVMLHFIARLIETTVYQLNYSFQFDLSIQIPVIWRAFTANLGPSLGLNLIASLIWLLILRYLIPFEKIEKDAYAEEIANLKEIV